MDDKILEIAEAVLHLETLETRGADRLDFHDLSVWSIKEALYEAYVAGMKAQLNAGE